MRCLTVDAADGLFCVGNRFTVTHNTATGVRLITEAGNQRVDLIARAFAEQGLKPLMLGIHGLCRRHSTRAQMIRLRGRWVPVDPRSWKTRYDMTVSVGLGTSDKMLQRQAQQLVLAEQKQLVQAGIVTPQNLYNAAARLVELTGEKSPEKYFSAPEEQPPQPPPDPMQDPAFMLQARELALKESEAQAKAGAAAAEQQSEARAQQAQMVIDFSRLLHDLSQPAQGAAPVDDGAPPPEPPADATEPVMLALQALIDGQQLTYDGLQSIMAALQQSQALLAQATAAAQQPRAATLRVQRQPDGSYVGERLDAPA